MAKADEEEFKRVWSFVHAMERLFEGRGGFVEEWWCWEDDDDDEDSWKARLRKIQKENGWEEEDDRVVFEFVKEKFLEANYSGSFGRILFDCQVLIDNCCDPDLDYLEFKPSIMHAERIALEKVEDIITTGEKDGRTAEEILALVKERIGQSKKEDEE